MSITKSRGTLREEKEKPSKWDEAIREAGSEPELAVTALPQHRIRAVPISRVRLAIMP